MKHPAKFTASIIAEITAELMSQGFQGDILDPFGGVGGVHELHDPLNLGWYTYAIELEPEWADEHERTSIGDATALPLIWANAFQAIVTSPPYGNRMADKDMRPTVAATYMKQLGRESSPGSMNHLQWTDPTYQRFAVRFMQEAWRVLEPGGPFLLNVKNHPRNKKVVDVVGWYERTARELGWQVEKITCIPTPGMRKGANRAGIVDAEALIVMRRPW